MPTEVASILIVLLPLAAYVVGRRDGSRAQRLKDLEERFRQIFPVDTWRATSSRPSSGCADTLRSPR